MLDSLRVPILMFCAALAANVVFGSAFSVILPAQIALVFTQVFAIGALGFVFNRSLDQAHIPRLQTRVPVYAAFVFFLLGVAIFSNILMALIAEALPFLQETKKVYEAMLRELLRSDNFALNVVAAVAVALIAPICEEYLFRGAMMQYQLKHQGVVLAVVLNGFLFSLMHLNPVAFLPLWIIGMVLAWSFWRTRNLLVPIVGHAALNTMNGVILPIFVWDQPIAEEPSITDLMLAFLFMSVVVLALMTMTHKVFPRRPNV